MDGISSITLGGIFSILKDHLWIGILAFILVMIKIYAVPIGSYLGPIIKQYFITRATIQDKRDVEQHQINERYFGLYEKSMDKLSEAVTALKEALIGIKSDILVSENRLHIKIDDKFDQVKDEIRNDKLDKIIRQTNPGFGPAELPPPSTNHK